ncbi:MAG: dienelactone hydrolase family protein [bacterium]|nr:MAG: dienelactone hydrolase family protein [bacterium]
MKYLVAVMLVLGLSMSARAEVRSELVEYWHGDTVLEGYLAWDDSGDGQRPGVVVFHDWMGEGPFDRDVVRKLAGMGYIALAADVYGKGVRPKDQKEAAQQAGIYRGDRGLMRARANSALTLLLENDLTDKNRVAATGYCFGGGVALELARSGAPLAGVVSFHGNLDTPDPKDAGNIKGKILVLHGADDPLVPPEQVSAFIAEMRSADVDWQMVHYGGAVHAFTNPGAGNDNSRGAAFNEGADRRSWQAMRSFFGEIFD